MLVSSTQHEHNVQALLQSNGLHLLLSFANTSPDTQVHYPKEHVMCGFGMKPNSHQILFDLGSLLPTPYSPPTYPPCAPSTYPITFCQPNLPFFPHCFHN
jgi:hypothetical protein